MISYELYQEMFSLRNLFFSKKNSEFQKKKQDALRPARENFLKLKKLLTSRGYRIIKSDDGTNYHTRKTKLIGLVNSKDHHTKLKNEPEFLRVLFTLAHETGHALQWSEDGNMVRLSDKCDEMYEHLSRTLGRNPSWSNIDTQDPMHWRLLTELYDFWYELDAWIQGIKFIPPAYHNMYKQYAKKCYMTYMTPYIKKNLSRFILELRMLDYSKY